MLQYLRINTRETPKSEEPPLERGGSIPTNITYMRLFIYS